ncbi:MAG TPA: quinone-dependent dihydroorotate dehydrogenase [Candidatus Nanoarchaeia archaeon]|nr:quinone-dependent dihydroorotate dehydrogenase [Candidatus Nanoarchaeia archaeon]
MSFQTKVYELLAKPVFFRIDPELTHDLATLAGRILGSNPITRSIVRFFFSYEHPVLTNVVAGIHFENPVGLAAGFDKNGLLTKIIPQVGFGFTEIGSITAQPCEGNPRPRLFRFPDVKTILVNYGLCNDGADVIGGRLNKIHSEIPFGINIAKTNDRLIAGDASVDDYLSSYEKLKNKGDYIVINISCPNSGDGCTFQNPVLLEKLLRRIGKSKKPLFLKISPDISKKNLDDILLLAKKYDVTGFIISNLTHKKGINGGFSGKPVQSKSLELVSTVYKKGFIIIGVGGIFTAEDAYAYIKHGASLVQLITGMIYRGPGVIREINKGLVALLKKDGHSNISEAIGTDVTK